jgi:uncharacterized protein YjeT (DUF2065 family)
MKWFLYAISLIYVSVGCCSILYTNETKNYVRRIFNNMDQKILSALPFIFGILFILSASTTHIPWLFRFIGLMAVIEGVVFFLIPKTCMKNSWIGISVHYQIKHTGCLEFLV